MYYYGNVDEASIPRGEVKETRESVGVVVNPSVTGWAATSNWTHKNHKLGLTLILLYPN